MEEGFGKARLATLLDHFALIKDPRDPTKVRYPLPEVLLLVVAAAVAGCDDYDEIAAWGEEHLAFLRSFSEFYFGTPGEDWLRVVMNRIDSELFQACFSDWASGLRPDSAALIALDGKTSRRSHDRPRGQRALHLVSAWATTERLVLAQQAVADKENECGAIPAILDRLDLNGALVTIDAIACNPDIAGALTDRKGDYLLAVKANQPTLYDEIKTYFDDPTPGRVTTFTDVDKGHGRIETRHSCVSHCVSHEVDWLTGQKRFPGEPRFPKLASIIMVESQVEQHGTTTTIRRYYLSSAALSPQRADQAIRGHWGIENGLHWVLDVIFREDQSRLRRGHGARNMAIVRHFALNLVRHGRGKHSIKTMRKIAGWNADELARLLGFTTC